MRNLVRISAWVMIVVGVYHAVRHRVRREAVLMASGATALVGLGFGAFVDWTGVPSAIKEWLNNTGK